MVNLPPWIVLDPLIHNWLLEDIGRGDRTTMGLFSRNVKVGKAQWVSKEAGTIAGLPIAVRVFQILNPKSQFILEVTEGSNCQIGDVIAEIEAPLDCLLMGERVGLNIAMRLSGIATTTHRYTQIISDLPTRLVDTRKTTPGLRILEKYATQVGGAINHRLGLDDAVMIKDNHIQAANGIKEAIAQVRNSMPYPLTIEVETSNISEVEQALRYGADIIMLDNMNLDMMQEAILLIRQTNSQVKIEASGNITLKTIRAVAETGVDYISSSAPITQSHWLDLSMRIL